MDNSSPIIDGLFLIWLGDWINDPANASKVVDENGEPLVVYRATNIKDGKIETKYEAFYFTPSKGMAENYSKQYNLPVLSFFLNAKPINSQNSTSIITRSDGKKVPYRGLFELPWNNEEVKILLNDKEAAYSEGEYLVPNPNQIKSATTDNNGMFSTENDDIQMAIQRPDYIEIEDKKEVEILKHDLFNKFKEKSSYGCIGHTVNYWYLCDYFGNSNYKIKAQIQIDGNEKFLNDIERKLGNRTYRDAESFVRRIAALASGEGQHYYGNVDVKIIRGETDKNAVLDSSKIENEENPFSTSSDGQSITDNAGTGLTISTENDWRNDTGFFQTPDATIYGFVAPNGNIYLDETIISPEHPIHEYTHLWDRIIAEKNPEVW